MVDFQKVKVTRLSDSVVLQHLWNSIDDLLLGSCNATKGNVIERCSKTYGVDINDINKNLFLALKEGTISRSVKTDVLSRIETNEDRSQGDWYCFLCHKVGPDTLCSRCGTSFHSNCNCDLVDQFHCHTCQLIGNFQIDFHKFSTETQRLIVRRILYVNKLKWRSLNVVGYLHDDIRNQFFIYKKIDAIEIDRKISVDKYFSIHKKCENVLFDLLLLRHNCAVIYGKDHAFYKSITGYIKHLQQELENIYCDSCYVIFAHSNSQKLSILEKQDLFCNVCLVQHPVVWGLVPPNVFWPFKIISEDNERYYGIKFSRSIHFNRHRLESFAKDTSLAWMSYNPQMCDRPSSELLKAFSLAQKYVHNLTEVKKNKIVFTTPMKNKKRKVKSEISSSSTYSHKSRKLNKSPIRKVGRPRKKESESIIISKCTKPRIIKTKIHSNISSTDSSLSSSPESDFDAHIFRKRPKNYKTTSNSHNFDDERKLEGRKKKFKRKFFKSNDQKSVSVDNYLSSTDSESEQKMETYSTRISKFDYTNHQPVPSSSSVNSSRTSCRKRSKFNPLLYNQYTCTSSNSDHNDSDGYSSDATIPLRLQVDILKFNSQNFSNSDSFNENIKRKRSSKNKTIFSVQYDSMSAYKYSAYSPSPSESYNYNQKSSINNVKEPAQNSLALFDKELPVGHLHSKNNLETGLYCSSSSPINFSPMSCNNNTNATQCSVYSTPTSNCPTSSDEITHLSSSTLKINLKRRAFQMSSPLQLGINIDPRFSDVSQFGFVSKAAKRNDSGIGRVKGIRESSSENDYR